MKKILLAGVATLALVGAASAADLGPRPTYKAAPMAPPVPAFSWTGCHVGGHVGWGWGRKDVTEGRLNSAGVLTPTDTEAGTGRINTSGGLLGGQVGCDYQFAGAWVFGIEGSASGSDIHGVGADPSSSIFDRHTIGVQEDFLGSVTGRIGWTGWSPQTLWYVRGGVAWTHDRWDLTNAERFFAPANIEQSRTGWTIGVGVEWAFAPNWSAFVEWDHYDFSNHRVASFLRCDGFCDDAFNIVDAKQRVETVKFGVNYRFNWLFGKAPVMARY